MSNGLQARRQSLGLTQPQVSAALRAVEPRADVPLVSRYERGVCLPTRPQLEALETALQAPRSDLYDPADLDLLGGGAGVSGASKRDRRGGRFVRKCYRMPRAFAASLPEDLFEVCGYSTEQSWFDACMKRLLGEYANRKKGMKRRLSK